MHGDGFCTLGEWSTSQSTAFMSAIAANIWNQNPNRTKDQVISMLRRDVYKSSEYTDNAQGRNEWTGRGIVQPGKTMKENIFPEIKTPVDKRTGKFYFIVSNWPADYIITGTGVSKDEAGYFIDLSKVNPGNYSYTFVGKCQYDGDSEVKWKGTYDFPINRNIKVVDPSVPATLTAMGNLKIYPNPTGGMISLENPGGMDKVKVHDITGSMLLELDFHGAPQATIDLSGFSPGVYIVHVTGANKTVFQTRVVKK